MTVANDIFDDKLHRAIFYSKELQVMTIVPKINGLLSMIGSLFIIYDILQTPSQRRKMVNKIMIVLSIADVFYSLFTHILGTWLVPSGQVYGSMGNEATCTFQGSISEFCGSTVYYNATLAASYLLMVRYEWSEHKLLKIQPVLLYLPFSICLISTIIPFFLDAYNYTGTWFCWIAPFPLECGEPGSEVECERGGTYKFLFLWLCMLPVAMSNIVIIGSMFMLYRTVKQQERAIGDFQSGGDAKSGGESNSKRVAMQGISFVGAFLITYFFYYIAGAIYMMGIAPPKPTWLYLTVSFFLPLQGFFNLLVYIRPRVSKYQGDNPDASVWKAIRFTSFKS